MMRIFPRVSDVAVRRVTMGMGAVVAAGVLTLAGMYPAAADDTSALSAVQKAAPDALASVANSTASTDGIEATVSGAAVSIPIDAADGLTTDAGNGPVGIGLPFAETAAPGVSSAAGTMTYDNKNGTSSVALVHDSGTIQVATVIDSAHAPTRYEYPLDLPDGAELVMNDAGARVVDRATGDSLGEFAAPWARDAHGSAVPTHYVVSGSTLVQVVEHDGSYAYPVVADPSYTPYDIYLSHATVVSMYNAINNIQGVCSLLPLPYWVGVACANGFPGKTAVTQAYWQNKRIKATYWSCGFNYCSYYTYAVVN